MSLAVLEQPVQQTQEAPPSLTDQQLFEQNIKDAYFDYDSYEVRPSDGATLQADAQFLNQHPNWKILIEGHCDERGSTEYNMALGDSRSQSAKQALISAGVAANRINTVSFGKELEEAYWKTEIVDAYCRILILARQIGGMPPGPR